MQLYVKRSKSLVALALENDAYYVLSRFHIVYKKNEAVYVFEGTKGKASNIVDEFELVEPELRYTSITLLSLEKIIKLRERVVKVCR